ncbi:MAG: 30S ribosomal protein S12 methylthiotransferase RimO [Bacteroidetes bacterium]|nr:30S ribosomal protein S12 methylthiotransferase RimO [Bacteroidota bacterium]
MKTKALKKDKVNIITLGCSKNIVDSEVMLTQLRGNDIDASHETDTPANIVIINTCGFIDRAKEESINTILDYVQRKEAGEIEKVFVTGCLSQRYKDDLTAEIPNVDAWFGTMELPALLHKFNADYKNELVGERIITTDAHFAYLKIAEGCDRPCSFCAIPLMRGKHKSRTIEDLVKEAEWLAKRGVKELMLIAQDLTFYGLDLYKERKLDVLLEKLSDVKGIEWIRLHYAYPAGFPTEILRVMRERDNICKYLDMPLQHVSDRMLKAMRRGINREKTIALINKIREEVPGIAIRTTLIAGYPGETEEDFQDLLAFVKEMRFNRLGVFEYSHEENTRAYEFEDDVPAEVKEFRVATIMAAQQDISFDLNSEMMGKRLKVIIDRREGEYWIGRTEFDSPEVDNEVLITGEVPAIGEFCMVEIFDTAEFDLFGQVV